MDSVEVFAFQSQNIINFGEDVTQEFIKSVHEQKFVLEDGDVVIITSKVLTMEQKAAVRLDEITPTEEAKKLAEKSKTDPRFAQLVINESDNQIYGAVFHAILAKTPYGLSANAGIDMSNAPEGYALLLPRNPDLEARRIQKRLEKQFGIKISVLISDSRTIPLRRGTTAVAIGIAGMNPLIDERGKNDLYGYKMSITTRAIADNIATAANLLMGETTERRPFAVVRGVSYEVTEEASMSSALMPEDQCLYFAPLLELIAGHENQ